MSETSKTLVASLLKDYAYRVECHLGNRNLSIKTAAHWAQEREKVRAAMAQMGLEP